MKKCNYKVTIITHYNNLVSATPPLTGAAGTAAYDQIRQGRDVDVTFIDDGSFAGKADKKVRFIVRYKYIGYVMYERVCEEVEAPVDANCKEG